MSETLEISRTPVLYLSHGAPPLADDPTWRAELAAVSAGMRKPTAILIVSAHWEAAPLTLAATETVPLVYDFWGFPEHYYQVQYAAPGAPELAAQVRKLVQVPGTPVDDDPTRGLDHGAYVPLKEMYPDADIPVLQMSLPTKDPYRLMELGRRLRPLRDEGVLIVGSGFITHGLPFLTRENWLDHSAPPPGWSSDFDAWAGEALARGDVDTLAAYAAEAPGMPYAHPTVEHYIPLFVTLGAATEPDAALEPVIDGFWMGLSKRSVQAA